MKYLNDISGKAVLYAIPLFLAPFVDKLGGLLFGGDWPVLTLAGDYSRWQTALDFCLVGVGESDLQKLFQTNAEKFYRI